MLMRLIVVLEQALVHFVKAFCIELIVNTLVLGIYVKVIDR